jgi:signal transduction histidine kinase
MNTTLIYFIYGLAFFSLGMAMLFESGRSPILAEATALLALAIFGLVHGSHEWLEMFLEKSEWFVVSNPVQLGWLRVSVLTISFVSLLVFGLRMLAPAGSIWRLDAWRWSVGLLIYLLVIYFWGIFPWSGHQDRIVHLDGALRYFLAVPSATIAGLAFYRQSKQADRQGRSGVRLGLLCVSWAFLIYALTQAVVPPLDIFPANLLNTASFLSLTGFPVQAVRAGMAITIATCLVLVVRANEFERQKQFLKVQQERVEALEQVQAELIKRENMRQELMRHIVIAQEDERARIARELHDETSQVLTAFSFHLAALRREETRSPKAREQVDYLQGLSRQMAQGLYRMVHDLRPAQLDDLGLVAALHYLISEENSRLGAEIGFKVDGERRRLDPLVETVFFRVAQEALTNVTRHANAHRVDVELLFESDAVSIRISDDGVGFNPQEIFASGKGWGLAGMRERCDSIEAQLVIDSTPGKGTTITMTAPVKRHAPQEPVDSQEQALAGMETWKQFA